MPELPEVESVRRSLLSHVLGRRVVSGELLRRDVLVAPGDPQGGFARSRNGRALKPAKITDADLLIGATIVDIRRLGKQLALIGEFKATAAAALGVQLGMTGHLYAAGAEITTPHTHARWTLDSGARVWFDDPRRFGGLRVFRFIADLNQHWAELGPDALSITGEHLESTLHGSARCVKAALLDQSVLAGVGNIYADEALFLAGIRPMTRCGRIRPEGWQTLARHIREVLADAVLAGGSTLRDYADANGESGRYQSRHRVYGRRSQPCVTCQTTLRSRVLAQRMTVWCPECQR